MSTKRILVLGGTQFIGRYLVEQLLGLQNADITLFNRQRTRAELFPELKKIKGDRETDDVHQIADQDWDIVIDLSCFYPASLTTVLHQLKGKLEKYILISTCSVYDSSSRIEMKTEDALVLGCTEEQGKDRSPETYGNRKAECERILMASELDYVILRPALVFGQYDHTDRFYYWLYQVKKSSTLLLPDKGERTFSVTYVKDLVSMIIEAVQAGLKVGIYNAISEPRISIRQIVDCAQESLKSELSEVNASPEFLNQNKIHQWVDMPLWLDGDHFTYSNELLIKNYNRKLTKSTSSIRETMEYYDSLNWPEPRYGMSNETKNELINKVLCT